MNDIQYAYVSSPDTHKKHQGTKLSLQQEVAHFDKLPRLVLKQTLPTDFQFTQYHPQTLKMKSYQKLSPTSNMLGVMERSIFMLCHKALSPYNVTTQFLIYTKFITHVYDVALNTSMHQCCVISIAPPTGHKNSDRQPPTASPPLNNQNTTDHKFF